MQNKRLRNRSSVRSANGVSRDDIVRILEQEILSAKLKPGERLDERAVSLRFGVSRAPVRDAVGRLASLGMIVVKPRSGSYVASLSTNDVLELLEVMSGLEGMCAYWAAQRLETTGQEELRRSAEACLHAVALGVEEYIAANRAFHNCIYEGTKNASLERLAKQVRQRVNAYRSYTFRFPGRLRQSAIEHGEIAEAICAGNAELAQKLTTAHTDIKKSDFSRFIALLEENTSSPSAAQR
jgi:DNA-binding GntR family transcriptional regulator